MAEKKVLDDMELRRYSRQIMLNEIGLEGQEKIKNAKVLVVGVGGLGCPVLTYLAAAGIGYIGICDNDLVVENNFQRQTIYGVSDLGKQKAIVAKQKLQQFNSLNTYNIHNIFISPENAEFIIKDYDIVIDCTDNIEARITIDNTCKALNKPMIYGAIYKFSGVVTVFNYKGGPSFRDLYPKHDELGNEVLLASATGVLGTVPGMVGCIQANEAFKIIIGFGEVLSGKMLIFDLLCPKFEIVHF